MRCATLKVFKTKAGQRNRTFTPEQLECFLQAALDTSGKHWHDFFKVLSQTGLRVSELQHLRYTDLDFDGNVIQIRTQPNWQPKSRSGERDVPMTPHVRRLLLERSVAHSGNENDVVFNMPRTHTYTFDRALKAAGLEAVDGNGEKLVAHSLRHGALTLFGQMLAKTGGSLTDLQRLARHSSITITQRYWHSTVEAQQRIVLAAFPESQEEEFETDFVTRNACL